MKITVYGLAATGTSTVSKLLAKKRNAAFQSSGGYTREEATELGMTIYEYEAYAVDKLELDIARDKRIAAYGTTHDNFVFDSRLAWHFIPDSFKVCLTADPDTTYRRIAAREECDVTTAQEMTEKRRANMEDRFRRAYPHITFPPPPDTFDLIIDTTAHTPDEVVEEIEATILRAATPEA